jgi:hypothetical protein
LLALKANDEVKILAPISDVNPVPRIEAQKRLAALLPTLAVSGGECFYLTKVPDRCPP